MVTSLVSNHRIAFGLQMLASLCCQPWGRKETSALAEVVVTESGSPRLHMWV